MLRTALALAARGMAVFPCAPRQKVPATKHGVKSATTDPETIRAWWRERPDCNVAIATGEASDVFVVDVDGAEAELNKLEREHGELPATVEVITARGRHLYFRMPDIQVRNSAGKIAPGIDIRADSGFVICPPSIHPSGKKYCWSVDSAGAMAAAPDWLLALISERTNGNGTATPSGEWQTLLANGIAEGTRDCALARLTGHLLRRYVDPRLTLELMHTVNVARCLPPLPEEDVCRVVNSICGKELKRRGVHA